MSELTGRQILDAFDGALELSSRWPRLLKTLGFDMAMGRPGPLLLNNALENRGFGRPIDESDSLKKMLRQYPDAWWFAIARETTGREDATVQQVVDALNARTSAHAAQ
jgi:hypothetical protein